MEIIINNQKFNVEVANTFLKKLTGLMFKKNIQKGLIFLKTGSIHTFFMFEKIDVIMLDKDGFVIYFQKNVKKNSIIIKRKAYYTSELPINSIHKLNIGDRIIFKH